MPAAKLEYTWQKDKGEKGEADPGIKFGVEDAGGEKVVRRAGVDAKFIITRPCIFHQ
jgi:hypothetical protein